MIRHHDSRTARTPCSSPSCGPRGSTNRAHHTSQPVVLAESEKKGRGDGPPCVDFEGAMVAEVLGYIQQLLASTSKKGQPVTTNSLRAREAEEVRKPIGEKGAEVTALVYSALLSDPVIE
jgi:hypothetical protein